MFNLPMASNARVAVKEYCDLIGKRAQYVTRKKPRTADHAPLFSSRVKIGNRSFPGASGTRIKCAEEEAARQAVRILQAEGKRKWKPFVVGVAGRNHGRSRELTKKSSRPISGSISSRLRYRDSRDCSSRTKPGDAFSHKTRLFGGLTNYSERRVYHDTDIRKRRTNVSTRTRIASRSATPRNFKTRGRNDTACKDPVSSLHEYCRAHGYADPELINFSPKKQKMDHRPVYVFAYKIDYRCYRRGRGNNKKIAKKTAAKCALDEIKAGRVPKVAKGKKESVFDSFAALSWTQYNKLERDVLEKTDEWKIASSHKILAAIILTSDDKDKGQVVSLGTGNRCIAGNNLVMDGSRINDSHAEVIARRGFLRYLYHNLELFYDGVDQDKSIFRQTTRHSKLIVKNNIEFHLYISTAPCGDARVFANDSTRFSSKNESDTHVGHKPSFTSKLQGVLRTKIENGEGTIPLSDDSMKLTVDGVLGGQRLRTTSCSDKILRWNVLGLQGTLLSHLMEPVYLTSVTVGSLFNSGHHCRALCCRVETEKENFFLKKLPGNYRVNHPRIGQGLLSDKSEARKTDTKKTTALSLNWTMSDGNQVEITDGCTGLVHSSQTTSRLAKCRIYQTFKRIAKKAELLRIRDLITGYRDAKRSAVDHCNAKRQLMKRLEEKDYGSWQLIQKSE